MITLAINWVCNRATRYLRHFSSALCTSGMARLLLRVRASPKRNQATDQSVKDDKRTSATSFAHSKYKTTERE